MSPVETIDTEVSEITRSVFESMLGWSVDPCEGHDLEKTNEPMMTGTVSITGNWEGAVSVVVSRRLAVLISAGMFGSDPENADEEEVRDALGEIANMIGGNFKSMLEPPVTLSLPSVTEGIGYKVFFPGCEITNTVSFRYEDEGLNVTILTRKARG